MKSVRRFLGRKLKLRVNLTKSQVIHVKQSTFLGFTFRGTKIRWSEKALTEFKRRVRKLTGRSWAVSMSYRLKKLSEYVRGWINYFGISEYYKPIPGIDKWLRRRIRMCYLKRWRKPRKRVRELTKLRVNLQQAIDLAMSRKGPWHLARTEAMQKAMTNGWPKDQGLVNVKLFFRGLLAQDKWQNNCREKKPCLRSYHIVSLGFRWHATAHPNGELTPQEPPSPGSSVSSSCRAPSGYFQDGTARPQSDTLCGAVPSLRPLR